MIRPARPEDAAFVTEMARLASVIEDRPLPAAAEVADLLPSTVDAVLVATDGSGVPVAAAWWHFPARPLVDPSVPEMVLAVVPAERGNGLGAALVEALAAKAGAAFDRLALNVHVRNPAIRLYGRTGFEVAGKGRGPLGVAMVRRLREVTPPQGTAVGPPSTSGM